MPVTDTSDTGGAAAGLYQWLPDQEEAEFADWQASVHARGGGEYPRRHILDVLRSGEPVNVQACSLPAWAWPGREPRWWDRATVHPDDRVVFGDTADADGDGVRRWLEENGL